jgi:hypothetical protein
VFSPPGFIRSRPDLPRTTHPDFQKVLAEIPDEKDKRKLFERMEGEEWEELVFEGMKLFLQETRCQQGQKNVTVLQVQKLIYDFFEERKMPEQIVMF